MAYRSIPKKFDLRQIAARLKSDLLYSDTVSSDVVSLIAARLGCSKRTVYAILDGEIKLTLDFLHAGVLASNADPKIRQYLEPDGMSLSFDHPATPDKTSIEAECLDDLPIVAAYHQSLMNPAAGEPDIKRALDAAIAELRQNYIVWAAKQGKSNNHESEN